MGSYTQDNGAGTRVVNYLDPTRRGTYAQTAPDGQQGGEAQRDIALGRLGGHHDLMNTEAGAAGDANKIAAGVTGRAGPQSNEYDTANVAGGANGNRAGAIELARRQALGQSPGAGIQSLQQGLNQASQQQAAMASGARGAAALATGQANRLANTSNLQQQAFSGAGMMRSQDMAAGRGLYNTLSAQARGQAGEVLDESNKFNAANADQTNKTALGFANAATGFGNAANTTNQNILGAEVNAWDPVSAEDEARQAQAEAIKKYNIGALVSNAKNND